jgi:hypothetical protein
MAVVATRCAVVSSCWLVATAFVGGCGSDDARANANAADGGVATNLASILAVDHLSVWQGVKVTLVDEGVTKGPNAPLVPGRPAVVRVHARVTPRQKVPKLSAELRLTAPDRPELVVTSLPRLLAPLDDGVLSSTFNFDLTAEQVVPGTRATVEIHDAANAAPPREELLRFPAEGDLAFNVGDLAPKLKVRFVPVRYQADGSDREPLLDKATIESYRKSLYKLYPVSEVEISIRESFNWPLVVSPSGDGWDSLLNAVLETRSDDQAPDDVYYVGIFNPAASEREYCKGACVLGVAPRGLGTDVGLRAAMVVGYPTERSHGTMAQEIAHAMGRNHAPCGQPAAVDRKYPYDTANIGVWGFDIVNRELVDPSGRVFDFMSYCSPVWTSDYTYNALYQRMVEVEKAKRPGGDTPIVITTTFRVARDGTMRPGPRIQVGPESLRELGDFPMIDAAHQTLSRTVRGSWRDVSGIGGGLLIVPPKTQQTLTPEK